MRILVSARLGLGLAAVIIVHGVSTSSARVEPAPPGTAASQLTALQTRARSTRPPLRRYRRGSPTARPDADAIHLLGSDIGGGGLSLYAARALERRCLQRPRGRQGRCRHHCADTLEDGISIAASDAAGWLVYGFAADGVVAVDVVVDGKPQPAAMLPNAYALGLGAAELGEATAFVVHHADGTVVTVSRGLQAPPSA